MDNRDCIKFLLQIPSIPLQETAGSRVKDSICNILNYLLHALKIRWAAQTARC